MLKLILSRNAINFIGRICVVQYRDQTQALCQHGNGFWSISFVSIYTLLYVDVLS